MSVAMPIASRHTEMTVRTLRQPFVVTKAKRVMTQDKKTIVRADLLYR